MLNLIAPTARDRLVDPPVPRDIIALFAELPDAAAKIEQLGRHTYQTANADVLKSLDQIKVAETEEISAQHKYDAASTRRDKTSYGHEEALSRLPWLKRLAFSLGYLAALGAMSSACFQTANWILAAQIFEHLDYTGALLLTGIVLSVGIGVPIAWSTVIDTDADRTAFLVKTAKFSAITGAMWLASFVIVGWCQDRADFVTMNGSGGSWLSLGILGSLSSLGKATMLPCGIVAECGASVAVKLAISRLMNRSLRKEWVPNPQRVALEEDVAIAKAKLADKRDEAAALRTLKSNYHDGLKVFVDRCLAEYRLHVDAVDADFVLRRADFIRNTGGRHA